MSRDDAVAQAPHCAAGEHHWIHRAQPDYPEWLAFIAYCSICGRFGPLDLRDGWQVTAVDAVEPHLTADLVRERDEALAEVEHWRTLAEALGAANVRAEAAEAEVGRLRAIEADRLYWENAARDMERGRDHQAARAEKAEAAIARVEALCDDAATCWPNTDGRPVASVIRIALVRAALRGDA